ncbi:MAG: helix-turn-helix transcriptional regulator [bacterium]|nr:helix-turn-helix transcriptional regulator [bacterium]
MKFLRKTKKITQKDLSEILGISLQAVAEEKCVFSIPKITLKHKSLFLY